MQLQSSTKTLLDRLADGASPNDRRRALLNALINLAMISDADFIEVHCSRSSSLLALQDEIMIWENFRLDG